MSSEEMIRAACIMRDAAETNLRAANLIADAVRELTAQVGSGYGNNLERLVTALESTGNKLQAPSQE